MADESVTNHSPLVNADGLDHEDKWEGAEDVMEDPDEQRVLFAALDSFYQYSKVAHYNTTHMRRQSFYALPQTHWKLLAAPPFSYLSTLDAVDDGIDKNAELAMAILKSGLESFGYSTDLVHSKDAWRGTATASDLDKARSTLRQFYRDWSAEGAAERAACLDPVIEDIKTERSARHGTEPMNVLVPGAGLGRLVYELCDAGFSVEGNEISYHQLLASSYILNYCPEPRFHSIFPWVHGFSNHTSRAHHLQKVQVPDVHPGSMLIRETTTSELPGAMSMSASDFLHLYNGEDHREIYDAVATVFFLDTAPNPIRYIQTIHSCLRKGGIWTNLGPLLWHFENSPPGKHNHQHDSGKDSGGDGIAEPGAVELTDDEVVALVEKFGFTIEQRESGINAGYIQDPNSMLQSTYKVSHWVARKM